MKSKLIKAIIVLIGMALAFVAGIYAASLLDPASHETAKEEKELPETGKSTNNEQLNEGVSEVSSDDNDGHKIEDPDPSADDDGLIIIESGEDSYEQAPSEYSGSDFYDEEYEDELSEVPFLP